MQSFDKIIDTCLHLSEGYEETVFIGGVAVYLHMSQRSLRSIRLEASYDADFMISFTDYGRMKDEMEITPNPCLSKHQFVLNGVEFDMYVERLHKLAVPYDDAYAQSDMIGPIHVACLEHLLVLKLEAFDAREHSSKGDKDRRDLAKIGLLLGTKMRGDSHPALHEGGFWSSISGTSGGVPSSLICANTMPMPPRKLGQTSQPSWMLLAGYDVASWAAACLPLSVRNHRTIFSFGAQAEWQQPRIWKAKSRRSSARSVRPPSWADVCRP